MLKSRKEGRELLLACTKGLLSIWSEFRILVQMPRLSLNHVSANFNLARHTRKAEIDMVFRHTRCT